MSHKMYGLKKILEVCCSSIEQLRWSLLGMHLSIWVFRRSGNVFPFSDDPFDSFRSFRLESKTTIKIDVDHDVLLIDEVHKVMERNRLLEIMTTIWYKTNFRAPSRMNCKFYRIIRRVWGFFVVVHGFLQKKRFSNSTKVEHWILIVGRYWWEISPAVAYVGSWKKRVAVAQNDLKN